MAHPTDEGDWLTIHEGAHTRVQMRDMGDGRTVFRTQHFNVQEVLDANAEFRAAQASAKWDEGKIVGRVPLGLYFASGMAEARKNADETWIKRFWNDRDNYKLRTKEGAI